MELKNPDKFVTDALAVIEARRKAGVADLQEQADRSCDQIREIAKLIPLVDGQGLIAKASKLFCAEIGLGLDYNGKARDGRSTIQMQVRVEDGYGGRSLTEVAGSCQVEMPCGRYRAVLALIRLPDEPAR